MASPVITWIASESSGDTGWQFSSASGSDRSIVFVRLISNKTAGDALTQTTAITASGLTFTRVLHEDFLMAGSGPHASIDVFTAPVPSATNISSLSWSATVTGDTADYDADWTYVFSVAGLGDINNPFDPNGAALKFATNLTGSSSAPSLTGFSTTNADDMLLNIVLNWGLQTTASATGGWSTLSYDPETMGSSAGEFQGLVQYKSVSAAQSGVTLTASYSDDYWASVAFAFTADAGGVAAPATVVPNTWASTETLDTASFTVTGYPGVIGNLLSTETPDTFAAVCATAVVGTMVVIETPDNMAARMIQPVTGALAVTETKDTFVAQGVGYGVNIALSATEALDIMVTDVVSPQPTHGVLDATETPDTFRALTSGAVRPTPNIQFFVA